MLKKLKTSLQLKTLFWMFCCLAAFSAQAQNKKISGTVIDQKSGKPLAGATVKAKGTKNTVTVTDEEGKFSLSVNNNANRLEVSYTGFEDADFEYGNSLKDIRIELSPLTSELDNVVVVGYGTKKTKDLTGSISSIGQKQFNKGVIPSVDNLFQGRVSGVSVTSNSGEPGSAFNINIRGANSIRSNNNPLFVVDGVPLSGDGNLNSNVFAEGSSTSRNPLSFINPNDIENITFLKDASSAAIYGSRGANGVILITTKGGKGANKGLTININGSTSSPYKLYDLADGPTFVNGLRATLAKEGVSQADIDKSLAVSDFTIGNRTNNGGFNTDWQKVIFRNGQTKDVNVAWGVNSKDGNSSLRVSANYFNQQGIVKNQALDRLTLRTNFAQNEFLGLEKLKLEVNFTIGSTHNDYAGISNNAGYQGSLIGAAIAYNPTYPVYNADGTFFDTKDGSRNPAAILGNFKDYDNGITLVSNVALNYKIWKNFVYRVNFGFEGRNVERNGFASPLTSSYEYSRNISVRGQNFVNSGINKNGLGIQTFGQFSSTLQEHTLTYNNSFTNSNLGIVLGYSYQDFYNFTRQQQFWGLEDQTRLETNFDKFLYSTPIYGDSSKSVLQSFFARGTWDLLERYYFTVTVRADGSSRFAVNNKYGIFPAASFKWKILNENWAQRASKVLDNLDIRVNYGITGNQEFGNYNSLELLFTPLNGGAYISQLGNPNLKWEQTLTQGVGVDFGFLSGIIRGSIDYFNKNTSDLLLPVVNAAPAPAGLQWKNLEGNVVNNGVELNLDFMVFKPKKFWGFGWNINVNYTTIKNKIENLKAPYITGEVNGQGLSGAYAQIFTNGQPLFTWKMPVFDGYDANGYAIYANGGLDQLVGSALPTYYGGLTNNFSLGRFTASLFIYFQGGNYIYNNTANALLLKGSFKNGRNVTVDVINSPESGINPGSVSTRFLEKGDFVRLQNLNISYNVPLSKKIALRSLQIGLTGQNLALFTNYSGLDPEVNVDKSISGIPSRGFDYTATPRASTYTLSINIGF
ncbi:MAG: SusC/RagA family TonB-linked outer membrane protein [Alphaproteobacteria bacterium]|nr:SusC/RagA family TonB-linked outer membrane protein [Alphaproteobacteria bacterium]